MASAEDFELILWSGCEALQVGDFQHVVREQNYRDATTSTIFEGTRLGREKLQAAQDTLRKYRCRSLLKCAPA
ncbi:hypothetical protein D9M68_431310 [compost metagenome]